MNTRSPSHRRSIERPRRSSTRLPVAILLSLCVLSVTTAVVQDDAPGWAEVMQNAG